MQYVPGAYMHPTSNYSMSDTEDQGGEYPANYHMHSGYSAPIDLSINHYTSALSTNNSYFTSADYTIEPAFLGH